MCLDTLLSGGISAGLGLAGTALAGQGAASNAKAQAMHDEETAIDNTLAAQASNAVLSRFINAQQVNAATNQTALQPEYAAIQPGAFEASRTAIAGGNDAAAQQGISDVLASGGPQIGLTNTDNGQSAAAINDAVARRTALSRDNASHFANLASYGQNFGQLGLNEMNTNEAIDQTNTKARSQASILPTDEQNAQLQARKFIPPADTSGGSTEMGLGSLLAQNAGGIGTAVAKGLPGLGKGIGSIFSSLGGPSVSNPTLSPSGGIGMA